MLDKDDECSARSLLRISDKFECKYERCDNMKQVGSDWNGEYYCCDICGQSYSLDYEEMR